jgi:Tol biopolymer transport system component/tRNA A-37 threonylcarbamoyl transferase component Bud32
MNDTGQTVLHYELLEKLGENLYKARDMDGGRTVALRILSPSARGRLDLDRYEQDLKSAASLAHPHIARIYEIAKSGDSECIAMEYVPGRTLEQALAGGSLPLVEALPYAAQIAGALQAAHAIGLTHGSLNPSNIRIAESGEAKLAGFGMAPAHPQADGWLSPEQAEGRGVDARSDIFSFGRVLEGMTGRAPQVHAVVERCTRKDPARRYSLMSEVRAALEKVGTAGGGPVRTPRRKRVVVAAAALALAIAAFVWWNRRVQPGPSNGTQITSGAGLACDPVISRDGRQLAYASDRDTPGVLHIWVQPLKGGAPVRLTDGQEDDVQPDFSPDGSRIAFRSERDGGGIYDVPTRGGGQRLVVAGGRNPRFSADGNWIAYWSGDPHLSEEAGIFVIPSIGGEPQQIQPDFVDARYPLWSPDGRHLLFMGRGKERGGDWFTTAVSAGKSTGPAIRTGARTVLGMQDVRPSRAAAFVGGSMEVPEAWVGDSIFFSGRMLHRNDPIHVMQIPISPSILQTTGASHAVTSGPDWDSQAAPTADGLVAFSRRRAEADLWSLPLDGKGEPQRLTQGAGEGMPSISSDGGKIVFRAKRSAKEQIWLKDLGSGKETPLADARRSNRNRRWELSPPVIAPSGDKVAYTEGAVFTVETAGGKPQSFRRFGAQRVWGWSADETRLLIHGWRGDLMIINAEPDDDRQQTIRPRFEIKWAQFSPDDRWLVLAKETEGHWQIAVASFRDKQVAPPETWVPLTEEGSDATSPAWSADGKVIYYISDHEGFRCIWGQRLDRGKPHGARFAVRHLHHARYSLVNAADPTEVGLTATRHRLLFGMIETTGNLFLLQRSSGRR